MSSTVGERICIIGLSCSGKSTLAAQIAAVYKLPVLHLDQIAHLPATDWVRRDINEFEQRHCRFITAPRWVVEGCYSCTMPERFARADTVIFLQMNRLGCLWRFIRRCRFEKNKRIGIPDQMPNSVSWAMIKHILWDGPRKFSHYERLIGAYPHLQVIRLRSFAEVDRLRTYLSNNPCKNG